MKNFVTNILKPTVGLLASSGFFVGIVTGCFCGNRSVIIKFEDKNVFTKKQIHIRHSLPLISGIACVVLFPSLLLASPMVAVDYFGNLCTFDKAVDKINSKYLIEYERFHQYSPNDNKYYAPSHFYITIKTK